MIVRRCTKGGYHVAKEIWPSVTEVQREMPEQSFEYASQNVLLQRFQQFMSDAAAGIFPPSFREDLQLWGEKASSVTILKWLSSDSGIRWLAASKTIQDNAWKDRGTLLHRWKDELARFPVQSDKEAGEWLEAQISSESELAKMTLREYDEWLKGERTEDLDFKDWHDRFRSERPQRAFDCTFDDVYPYLLSLRDWWADEAPDFVWVERILLNPRKKVAGRADGFPWWRGSLFLADFKSRKTAGPKAVDVVQMGGYFGMTHYYDADSGEIVPFEWPEGTRLIVFTVTPKKVYPYEVKNPAGAIKRFNAALTLADDKGLFYDYRETDSRNKRQEQIAV